MSDLMRKLDDIIQRENDEPLTLAEFETLESIYSVRVEMLAAIVELRGALETIANDHDWNLNARGFAADAIAKANTEKWV